MSRRRVDPVLALAVALLALAGLFLVVRTLAGPGITAQDLALALGGAAISAAVAIAAWLRERQRAVAVVDVAEGDRLGLENAVAEHGRVLAAREEALEEERRRVAGLRLEAEAATAARLAAEQARAAAEEGRIAAEERAPAEAEAGRQALAAESARHAQEEGRLARAHEERTAALDADLAAERQRTAAEAAQVSRLASELESSRRDATALRERLDRTMQEAARQAADARRDIEETQAAVERERHGREREESRRRSEHEWNEELKRQVATLEKQRGVLGDPQDTPSLVLQVAIRLLEAEKGLLLSRIDEDGDGDLELIATHGFLNPPDESAVAQRFAAAVIERDRTIREDQPTTGGAPAHPADAEIRNIVAIPIYISDDFRGIVVCANREGGFEALDEEVLLALGGHAGALMQNARLRGRLRDSYLSTVRVLSSAMEAKEGSLRGHGDDVARYAAAVAEKLGLERRVREEVVFGSLLHDVGKIGISELILLKPGPLTLEEFSLVRMHPRIGYRLVEQVPELRGIGRGILHHHERFDGGGYPSGLRGEEIPQEARIISVADAFSAMTADRPYRRVAMSSDEACDQLRRNAGTQFDPEIVRIFIDEVGSNPPTDDANALLVAMMDPELATRVGEGSLPLGSSAYGLTDMLTLLYSHRYLHERLDAEVKRSQLQDTPLAVVLVELTGIADLNLREGYAAGDMTLQAVAAAARTVATQIGGVACREGGRRIAIICPYSDEHVAQRVAEDVVQGLPDGIAARAGLSMWRDGDTSETLLMRARLGLGELRARSLH